jgi:transcription elongation factor Elf1
MSAIKRIQHLKDKWTCLFCGKNNIVSDRACNECKKEPKPLRELLKWNLPTQ